MSALTVWQITLADGTTERRSTAAGVTPAQARAHWLGSRHEISAPDDPVEAWSPRVVAVDRIVRGVEKPGPAVPV